MSKKRLYLLTAAYFIILIGFMTFPVTVQLINRIYPYILGFPCFQFFILLFVILAALGLMVLFILEDRIEKKAHRGEFDD
ncbi:hypothetical protein [Sinanaerobacter chloroacetimidivorans]|uniref:DUF3311 domain-containing protein n=1 Tax=Sinanaerobacter chloroacetimidivorans TaxID=2818044 RepID=A0A8J7VYZ5_9FIRM|nr:hypothetical protein [Sinanaerobacter chloroacetimidivorans]MBR0597304.1 DUF3311 domain-containing protein [Sinanaerobacter chloroacetimidivorans]